MPAPDSFADLIEPFSRRGVDLGLDRLQAALAELGHPERRFAAVQVAGTNGKGSICTLLEAALTESGIRCGLYTSPHLVSWCERIRVGGAPIAEADLRAHLLDLQDLARRHRLTPFELVTAAAFVAFAEAGVELAVLEVGLGGRLDATTTHPDRGVIGFATIGLDHQDVLGDSLQQIAFEKAGVLRPGSVAVSGPQDPAVEAVLERQAEAVAADLRWVPPLAEGASACGLPGAVQATNAAVALAMLEALRERGWALPAAALARGVARAHWPGRLQRTHWRSIPLLLDGAHNLPAAVALRSELDGHGERHGIGPGPRRWVLGILAAKQGPQILQALLAPQDRAWIVPVPSHACWSHPDLAASCPSLAPRLAAAEDLATALMEAAHATPATAESPAPVIVAGSLYLIGHLLASC